MSCGGVAGAAQPFLAAVVHRMFPRRPLVVITGGLKAQELFHQDLTACMGLDPGGEGQTPAPRRPGGQGPRPARDGESKTVRDAAPAAPWFYPGWEILPHEERLPHADVISERLETLVTLSRAGACTGPRPVVVASVMAMLQRTFSPATLARGTRAMARGDRCDPLDLVEWLEAQGYEPEAQVTQKGELSLRGGILDVYPLTSPWPVRFEFFGDELESLRHFDPLTQISREEIAAVALPPAGELGILRRMRRAEGVPNSELSGALRSVSTSDLGPSTPDLRSPHPALRPPDSEVLGTLLDYLPAQTILMLCEPDQLEEQADQYAGQVPEGDPFFVSWPDLQQQAEARGMTVLGVGDAVEWGIRSAERGIEEEAGGQNRAQSEDRSRKSEVGGQRSEEGATSAASSPASAGSVPLRRADEATAASGHSEIPEAEAGVGNGAHGPRFLGLDAYRPLPERPPEPHVAEEQRRQFFAQMHRWLRQGYAVEVFCNNQGERQRFTEIWVELGYGGVQSTAGGGRSAVSGPGVEGSALEVRIGALSSGFLYDEAKVVVVTDAEVFGRYKIQRPRRLKSPHAHATRSALDIDFAELEEGDYVVHLQHGIGRYQGLEVLPLGAGTKPTTGTAAAVNAGQECLVIEYAPGDPSQPPPKLYVPVTEAHLVSKYVGAGKARPPLNTLGGTRWLKTRTQAERAVRDVAGELLAIQAARESQPGWAFAPDAPWQREFESAFVFEETADQLRAIVETKADMERPKPMDRLICGDVGFGKTEVAIRAAFKAVLDGKQVAVLVPTTVLAQQHYNTFRESMADYPVRLELLSRFRSRRAQQEVVRGLATGAVDIVIGTHRLVQPDVTFKDLGLVVIDEEQRFGVMHKEKFKMLRRLVDVLTLSATPIPRTLYLALSGARDMSTVQTPPHDRLPVETVVTEYDERLIRDAIQREMNRGGQVFFLHNRVMTIETMARKLGTLLPQARVVVGHGQMHSDDLEEVMTRFVNGAADVLLSTTIIESGLDIPNANTIIIDRADRFGLSDLYQLRGRVGRYKHQAYAYLLLPRHARLLTDVRKRMSAIRQYSTLGSGFKIAMRDLEIRGAGNLLGAEQSGHITAVGFELYCQLLKQSIASAKGEKVKPRLEVQIRFEIEAGIPLNYIADPRQRIEIYRKLAQASEIAAVDALETEARDRFGPPPPPLERLLKIARLRVLAAERGIHVLEVKDDKLMLTRDGDYVMIGSRFPRLTQSGPSERLEEIEKFLLAL